MGFPRLLVTIVPEHSEPVPFKDEPTCGLHAAIHDVEPVASRARGGVKGVLIVDDSEDMRLLLRVALDAAPGFEVWAEAGNGAEALDRVSERCPDIVLLDIVMPVMDGVAALPLLRARCPNAAVVIVSTTANPEVRDRMLGQGASEVCDKTSAHGLIETLSGL